MGSQVATSHAPVAQDSEAWARVQAAPQAPQFVRLVKATSQPLAAAPSQSPKPGSHDATAQVRAAQVSSAWARLHETPHPPQLVRLAREVSQPSAGCLSQSAYPASQTPREQVPRGQVSAAWSRSHALPQAPQSVSVSTRTSHPSLTVPLQSP
jgi:hypothetical protein